MDEFKVVPGRRGAMEEPSKFHRRGPKRVVLCGRESRVHLPGPYFNVEGLLGHAPRKLEKGEVREAPKVGKFFSAGAILIGQSRMPCWC